MIIAAIQLKEASTYEHERANFERIHEAEITCAIKQQKIVTTLEQMIQFRYY